MPDPRLIRHSPLARCVAALGSVVLLGLTPACSRISEKDIAALDEQILPLQQRNAELRSTEAEMATRLTAQKAEIDQIAKSVANAEGELKPIDPNIFAKIDELTSISDELKNLMTEIGRRNNE